MLSGASMAATSNAVGNLGNTIAQIGKAQFGHEVQLARIENGKKLSDMKRMKRESVAAYQNKMMTNHDPSTWADGYTKHVNAAGDFGMSELSPEAQDQWSAWEADYSSKQHLRIARDATIAGIQKAKSQMTNNISEYARSGNYEGAYEELDDSVEAGIISPEQGEKQRQLLMNDQERNMYEGMIDEDPARFLNTLKQKDSYEKMPDDTRRRLIKATEREVSQRRGQDYDSLKDLVSTGEIKDPDQLDDLIESGQFSYLESGDIASMKKHLKKDTPMSDEDSIALTLEIDNLRDLKGTVSDAEYIKQYRKLQNKVLEATQTGEDGWIRQRLNYYNPNYDKSKPGADNPLLKKGKGEAMEEASKHLNILFKNGDFGATDNGEEGSDKVINAQSAKVHREIQRDVEQWIQDQDKPVTIDEVHKYMGGVIEKKTGQAAGNKFMQSLKDSPYTPKGERFKAGGVGDAIKFLKGSSTKLNNIPYNGVKASVRYNNPAAAYPRKGDEKYGLEGYGVLKSGQGTHKIGRFPTPVHGAAANFDLFAEKYEGMTFKAAVAKWRGNTERGEKVVVPAGYDPDEKISKKFLDDPKRAMDFFSKMASHESAGEGGLSNSEWRKAWDMWKAGGSKKA
jgi:hypothetical protein